MKPIYEERIFIKKDLSVAFKEVICKGSKIVLSKKSSPIEKNIIFLDNFVVFEPAKIFEGGKTSEYIANNSIKATIKYVIVKSKYVGVFEEVLAHYLKLTNQKYKSQLLRQFRLLRNNVILIKLGKCSLKGLPSNLSLEVKEIKARLDAMYGKTTDLTINKVMVRGKLKQIQRIL